LSRVIAVIIVSTILATSSLVLNIGVAEATHDSNASVTGRLSGTFDCPIGQIGSHEAGGSFRASTSANPSYGSITLFRTNPDGSISFPLLIDNNIDNPPSISSSGFTLTGTLRTGGAEQYCAAPPDGKVYEYTINGEQCINGVVDVDVVITSRGTNPTVGGGTLIGNVNCHPAATSNQPPVAESQGIATDEDTAVGIKLRATDPNGGTLTYTIVSGPFHGTLSGTAPDVTYTPAPDFNGEDRFTFKANDGTADSNIATVSITVRPGNDNPTVNALVADPTTINEGGGTSKLTASATDPDGDSLTYSWSQTAGTTGTITVDDENPSIAFYEAPLVRTDETATIQVTVNDGSEDGIATASVDVTVKNVNRPPVAQLTANPSTINEGETSALDASRSSDPDVGDSLTYSFTINGPGTITDHSGATDPTATYQAPPDVSSDQTVTIQVEVSDDNDGGINTATAQIAVKDIPAPEVEITRAVDSSGKEIKEGGTTPIPYIRVTFKATSAVAIETTECSLDSQEEEDFTSCSSPVVYDRLSRGNHEVTVRVTNEAGKTGEDQFKWTVGAPPSAPRPAAPPQEQPSSAAEEEEAPVQEAEEQPSLAEGEEAAGGDDGGSGTDDGSEPPATSTDEEGAAESDEGAASPANEGGE
jgi:hypothetical protein